jgi:DNA-directed RNA polymerase specialized sigma24 family protein
MARRRRVAWSERRVQVAELLARHEQDGRSYRELALAAELPLPTVYAWLMRCNKTLSPLT